MKIEFLPSLENQLEAYKYWPKPNKLLILLRFLYGTLLFFSVLGFIISYRGKFFALIPVFLIFAIVSFLLIFGVIDLIKMRIKSSFTRDERYSQKQFYEFLNDSIMYHTDNLDVKLDWNRFKMFGETENTFLIIRNKREYIILPKEAFTASDMDVFKELLSQKLDKIDIK